MKKEHSGLVWKRNNSFFKFQMQFRNFQRIKNRILVDTENGNKIIMQKEKNE